jgi:hypothetical protein
MDSRSALWYTVERFYKGLFLADKVESDSLFKVDSLGLVLELKVDFFSGFKYEPPGSADRDGGSIDTFRGMFSSSCSSMPSAFCGGHFL